MKKRDHDLAGIPLSGWFRMPHPGGPGGEGGSFASAFGTTTLLVTSLLFSALLVGFLGLTLTK